MLLLLSPTHIQPSPTPQTPGSESVFPPLQSYPTSFPHCFPILEILSIVGEANRLKMDRGNIDWEESSRAGRSRTFDGLEDIVADMGESASKPHGKKKAPLKKVAGVKKPSATTKKRAQIGRASCRERVLRLV